MFEVPDHRHFANCSHECDPEFLASSPSQLHSTYMATIEKIVREIMENIDEVDMRDGSMYTGVNGILYFLNAYLSVRPNPAVIEFRDKLISILPSYIQETRCNSPNISVFTSHKCASLFNLCSMGVEVDKNLNTLFNMSELSSVEMPDEALYGRAGYLAALFALKEKCCPISVDVVRKVVEDILNSGVKLSKFYAQNPDELKRVIKCKVDALPPLMFEWHGTQYLGAAHGYAGILSILLKARRLFPCSITDQEFHFLVMPSIKWISEAQYESGNWPSSLGENSSCDRLVHWCHGATGLVPLLAQSYLLQRENPWFHKLRSAASCVWTRGLLKKGCGLCHGSAGSGFALLTTYNALDDDRYLHQSIKFANWCLNYKDNRTMIADRPYSLFEGSAGTGLFLLAILDPHKAKFPFIN